MMHIAVLGCGPAGMMVAHALAREQVDFDIFSDRAAPSPMGGAMYLHVAVPGLTEADPDGRIQVIKRGTEGGYRHKIGRNARVGTSWTKFKDGLLPVWNLQAAYAKLWTAYSGAVKELKVHRSLLEWLLGTYDAVYSTIPKWVLCGRPEHEFATQQVWIRTGEDLGVPADTMIYSGKSDEAWYRASNIFGSQSKEYPREQLGGVLVRKPLFNTCNCHPEVFRFGRYGCWEKHWLTHDAYTGARDSVRMLNAVHKVR